MILEFFFVGLCFIFELKHMQKINVLLSSLFGKPKAFFCFWFNKRIIQKAAQKLNCFYIRYRSKTSPNPCFSRVKQKLHAKKAILLVLSTCKKKKKQNKTKNATVVFAPTPSILFLFFFRPFRGTHVVRALPRP